MHRFFITVNDLTGCCAIHFRHLDLPRNVKSIVFSPISAFLILHDYLLFKATLTTSKRKAIRRRRPQKEVAIVKEVVLVEVGVAAVLAVEATVAVVLVAVVEVL